MTCTGVWHVGIVKRMCVRVFVYEKVPAELRCAFWIVYDSPAVLLRTEQSCARIAPEFTRPSPLVMHGGQWTLDSVYGLHLVRTISLA